MYKRAFQFMNGIRKGPRPALKKKKLGKQRLNTDVSTGQIGLKAWVPAGLQHIPNVQPQYCLHCKRPWQGFHKRGKKLFSKCCKTRIVSGKRMTFVKGTDSLQK